MNTINLQSLIDLRTALESIPQEDIPRNHAMTYATALGIVRALVGLSVIGQRVEVKDEK